MIGKVSRIASTFQRLTMRMFLIVGLSLVHFWATFDGMRELIPEAGIKLDDVSTFLTPKGLALILVVFMLTAMIVFTLHIIFSDNASRVKKVATVAVYLFLEVVSVGLGFGFYWKILNSTQAAASNVGAAEAFVERAFAQVSRDIASAAQVLETAASYSQARSEEETKVGNTCRPLPSGKGCGPICMLRKTDAENAKGWNNQIKDRVTNLNRDIESVKARAKTAGDRIKAVKQDEALRAIQQLNAQLAGVTSDINKLATDPQIRAIAKELEARAARQDHASGAKGGSFRCVDPILAGHLSRAAGALQSLPTLKHTPQVPSEIGSEATKSAFFRLLAWLGQAAKGDFSVGATSGIDPTTGQMRGQNTLTQSDLLALVLAIAVDVGLLYVTAYKDRPALSGRLIETFNQFDDQDDAGLGWRLLGDVHLRTFHGHYLAIPDTTKEPGLSHLNSFIDRLEANGEVSRAWFMWSSRVKKRFEKRHSMELAKYDSFNVYYVSKVKMAQILDAAESRVRGRGRFTPSPPQTDEWARQLAGQAAPAITSDPAAASAQWPGRVAGQLEQPSAPVPPRAGLAGTADGTDGGTTGREDKTHRDAGHRTATPRPRANGGVPNAGAAANDLEDTIASGVDGSGGSGAAATDGTGRHQGQPSLRDVPIDPNTTVLSEDMEQRPRKGLDRA